MISIGGVDRFVVKESLLHASCPTSNLKHEPSLRGGEPRGKTTSPFTRIPLTDGGPGGTGGSAVGSTGGSTGKSSQSCFDFGSSINSFHSPVTGFTHLLKAHPG